MKLKLFYAWQSDTPGKVNHYFIRDAAEMAIAKLNADMEVEEADPIDPFELDHDTNNVPGSPPVAETICRKIDQCTLFIGDMTTVGEFTRTGDGRAKKTANPNVLVELGYARKAKGTERIITVMNLAFGTPDDLPFDLKHLRHPIKYELADRDDPQFKAKQRALGDEIARRVKEALGALGEAEVVRRNADLTAAITIAARIAEETRRKFELQAVSAGQFRKFDGQDAVLTYCLIPLVPPESPINLVTRRSAIVEMFGLIGGGAVYETYSKSLVAYASELRGETYIRNAVAELTNSGTILSATDLPYDTTNTSPSSKPRKIIRTNAIETELFSKMQKNVNMLRKEGVHGPLFFGLSFHRVNGVTLMPIYNGHELSKLRAVDQNSLVADPVTIQAGVTFSNAEAAGRAVKGALDAIWRDCGLEFDPILGP